MEAILPGVPWLIAHLSMLGINKPHKATLNGKDYVLWQNEQGEVFALDNVCPHMQAPLSDGWICQERGTIACPFPALTTFQTSFPLGEILQVHVLYPETETRTKTFVLVYSKLKHPVLKPLLGRSLLSAVGTVVEQDTRAIETSYPRQKAKIRLRNEEIMFHAEKLYREW